jgi:hypothetical protein
MSMFFPKTQFYPHLKMQKITVTYNLIFTPLDITQENTER